VKRVSVKLFVQDPTTKELVPMRADPDTAQVTQQGKVLVQERHFQTWREIGTVPEDALEDFMRAEAHPFV
jgi:hypothetical protein